MAWRQIDRARWASFFQQLAKDLIGKRAAIEIASLDLGDQIEAAGASLIGIAYEERDDLIEIALEDLDHLIRSPREVFVDAAPGGPVSLAIVDGEGRRQIVRLNDARGERGSAGRPRRCRRSLMSVGASPR
jgi:hypothetical protein